MKELWRKLGIPEAQNRKNSRHRWGWFRHFRISEASAVVMVRFRVVRYSERSGKGSEEEWRSFVTLQMRSRLGRG